MTAGIAEILADCSTGKRGVILQRSRVARRSCHNDGVIHRTVLAQCIYDRCYRRTFLADSYVDTVYGVACLVVGTLVDDGIDGNRGLTRLTVADNQLTLPAADRNHGIDSLQTGLQRLVYRLTVNNARCFTLQRHFAKLAAYQPLAVQRFAQRVDNTSQHTLAYHNGSNTLGTFHHEAFLDFIRRA